MFRSGPWSVVAATLLLAGCSLALEFESVPEGSGGKAGSGGTSAPAGGGGSTASGTTSTTTFTDPPICAMDAECDSGNPCQIHTCQNATCHHDPVPDGGRLPDDDLHDCARPVCKAGAVVLEVDPTQDPDTNETDCQNTYCLEEGGTMTVNLPANTACGVPSADPCKASLCDGNGTCSLQSKPDGQVVSQGNDLDCRDTVCQGGTAVQIPNFLNCPDPNPNNCLLPSCSDQGACTANGMVAPQGYPCMKQSGEVGLCEGDDGVCT